ncbi:unnamed protein product [Closterium sp. NIES-53]
MAAQELCWLTYLLTDLGERPRSSPVLYVDNKAMIALCQEHILEHRTKHIALCYFLARELQQRGQLRLACMATQANTADIFTKALQLGDHQCFCTVLGLLALFFLTSLMTTCSPPLCPWGEKWKAAMATEVAALKSRGTWKLVPRSSAKGRNFLSGKWVFHIKTLADGSIDKYKARWVVSGFEQTHMVDFDLTYAPVGRHTSVRILICIAAVKQRPLCQIDDVSEFLYAPIDAIIFVEQPHAFEEHDAAV